MMSMSNAERAKIFCRMSFVAPSEFPCVETYSAAKIFNYLTFADFTHEDFRSFLLDLFGENVFAGNEIFYLARTDFYKRADKTCKINDWKNAENLVDELENLCNATQIFEGGENLEIYP